MVNNRLEKSKYSIKEEIANRKEHWQSYMATFKAEIQGILQSSELILDVKNVCKVSQLVATYDTGPCKAAQSKDGK